MATKSYQEFEKEVFDWLIQRHHKDRSFTFSVRQKASKGAEADYFIGKEKSKYFGTTFWYIPIGYPGSSADLIDLMFKIDGAKYSYHIQFLHTRNPTNLQNTLGLKFIQGLKPELQKVFPRVFANDPANKLEYYQIHPLKPQYNNIKDLIADVDNDVNQFIPVVENYLKIFKSQNPEFEAARYTTNEFSDMVSKMELRRQKYSKPILNSEDLEMSVTNSYTTIVKETKQLNQILFGPPGSGKTFNTINKALSIVSPLFDVINSERSLIHAEFDKYIANGQIRFVTFHQSMAYEDFIEGIKPVFNPASDVMEYPVVPGIFKNICLEAIKSICTINDTGSKDHSIESQFDDFIQSIRSSYTEGEFPFETKEGSVLKPDKNELDNGRLVVYYKWSNNSTRLEAGKTPFPIKRENIRKMFEAGVTGNEQNLKSRLKPFLSYHLSPHYAVYKSFLEFLRKKGTDNFKVLNEGEVSNDFESYLEQLLILNRQNRIKKAGEPYVLIIDEINRANASQVFGEIITLLEEDKRLCNSESLTVRLPYSRGEFAVPNNLHIIGTMNTADRSVEALDTALRRRFVFEEILPDPMIVQQLFEKDFLGKCAEKDHLYWDDAEWKEIEKDYIEVIPSTQYELFKSKVGSDGPAISLGDYKSFWAETEGQILTKRLLETINARIEVLLDRDHLIGHSYFINKYKLDDIKDVFYKSIIPMLQEYFYGDYGKIGLVLGPGFVERRANLENEDVLADFDYPDIAMLNDKIIYDIVDHRENDEHFIEINGQQVAVGFNVALKLLLRENVI